MTRSASCGEELPHWLLLASITYQKLDRAASQWASRGWAGALPSHATASVGRHGRWVPLTACPPAFRRVSAKLIPESTTKHPSAHLQPATHTSASQQDGASNRLFTFDDKHCHVVDVRMICFQPLFKVIEQHAGCARYIIDVIRQRETRLLFRNRAG